ncbi:MAG: 2-aminoethylphosphonate--pyruvate transaminase [Rhodospirillales bacterium]
MPNIPDPILLTPGPLTTAAATKQAMLHDWGSRDGAFIEANARILNRLLRIAEAEDTHVCVPVQGSGTFAVEAMLGTLIPKDGKALVLVNGAYGARIVKILKITGRAHAVLETPEDTPNDIAALDAALKADAAVTHVVAVHCETTSGILNPIEAVAETAAKHGKALLIDAMSAFGALPLSARKIRCEAVAASSNKCLEGVPGVGFVLVEKQALNNAEGRAHSLALDLHDQHRAMESNGQWRFTPPTHVLFAFDKALDLYEAEGGQPARLARYAENCRVLINGMKVLGFTPLLRPELQAPIIVTFHTPDDSNFVFADFYERLRAKGYVIYPGKLTVADSFRIGCIGALEDGVIAAALGAIETVLSEMGVRLARPAA